MGSGLDAVKRKLKTEFACEIEEPDASMSDHNPDQGYGLAITEGNIRYVVRVTPEFDEGYDELQTAKSGRTLDNLAATLRNSKTRIIQVRTDGFLELPRAKFF